jgi:hypothetical protein
MALAEDLAAVLETLGYGTWGGGTTPGATIFNGSEPDSPAVVTTIYATGGPMDTLTYDGDTYGERSAQIRMRDTDRAALETRLESLYALWAAWKTYGAYYLRVKAATKPFYGYPLQDGNQGNLCVGSFNIVCIKGS